MSKRLVAAATASGVVLLGTTAPSLAVRPARTGGQLAAVPDVTVLFGQAVKTIRNTKRPTYAGAVVYEADGITRGGRCTPLGCTGGRGTTSASGVVSWRFVFDNYASRSRFKSATLTYGPPPKRLGGVRGFVKPFADDIAIPRAPKLTLGQAVALVRRAGHRAPFFNVTLRNPLGPKKSNPLYIFGFAGNRYFAVDTVTKKVRPFS
jgi:hypothetical protein